jgi:hypothetical protein
MLDNYFAVGISINTDDPKLGEPAITKDLQPVLNYLPNWENCIVHVIRLGLTS